MIYKDKLDRSAAPVSKLDLIWHYVKALLFLLPSVGIVIISSYYIKSQIPKQYDIYKNGETIYAEVLSVSQGQKRVGSRRYRRTVTIYNHQVKYAGIENSFESSNKVSVGNSIKIYYSTKNPKSAMLASDEVPYPNLIAALLDGNILWAIIIDGVFIMVFIGSIIMILNPPKNKSELDK